MYSILYKFIIDLLSCLNMLNMVVPRPIYRKNMDQ